MTLGFIFPSLVVFASTLSNVESRTCFRSHPRPSACRRRLRHPREAAGRRAATSSGRRGSSSSSREEEGDHLRREATEALLPVFFPGSASFASSPTDSTDGPDRGHASSPITAEASLKRLLREHYQCPQQKGCVSDRGDQNPLPSVNESRGRLAELILGTSVMRLRHWYVVVAMSQNNMGILSRNGGAKIPIPHPLAPSLLSLVTTIRNNALDGDPLDVSKAENHNHSMEETLLVRAMVDEHANYLSSSSNHTITNLPSHMLLSIRYSLPTFLASSLLWQYGYTRAEEICELMNSPGPITLRRNAFRFPGSDADLCKWLWDEDGIEAIGCNQLHQLCQYNSKLPTVATSSSDGSNNRYVVGSSSVSNSIPPPDGAIRIITPELINNATTVQRRRRNKSIWSMKGWQNGYFEVQDAGSQIITQSLEAKPGESILDYCAGNGGKTFGLASAVLDTTTSRDNIIIGSNSSRHDDDDNYYCDEKKSCSTTSVSHHGKIVAHDVIDERLRQIRGSMKRVGFSARVDGGGDDDDETFYVAKNSRGDAECSIRIATSSDLDAGIKGWCTASSFDAVLVDAPCSSTGVLRRRPSQRWDLAESDIYEGLPTLQLEILVKAASFVREGGGRLVYSTCSLLEEENECVARKFEQSPAGRSFERWDFFPKTTTGCCCDSLAEEDDDEQSSLRHTLSLLPSADGSDGFFIARWKKRGGTTKI